MKIINIGKLIALAIAILGVIHNIATFTPIIKDVLLCLPPGEFKFMLYANLMCGSFFIISGLLLVMLLNKIENYPFLLNPIFFIGSFLFLSGILLVVFSDHIFDNPFACIGLLLDLAIFGITATLFFRQMFPNKPKKWYNYPD